MVSFRKALWFDELLVINHIKHYRNKDSIKIYFYLAYDTKGYGKENV